jgi:hypothetical protein
VSRTIPIDPARRAKAIELAGRVGATQASRETGISASTIRAWVSRSKQAPAQRPAAAVDAASADVERMARTMELAKDTAEELIRQLRKVAGQARSPQSLAIATGVLLDKAAALEAMIATAQEREVAVAEREAELIAQVIKRFVVAAVGPGMLGDLERKIVRSLLRQAAVDLSGGTLDIDVSDAERLRSEAKARLRAEIKAELRQEWEAEVEERLARERAAREQLALPAPEPEPDPVPDEPEPDVEVVTGEVVPEEPLRRPRRMPPYGTSVVMRRVNTNGGWK